MIATEDLTARLEKVDEEIIRLIAERVALCQEAAEEDPEALGGETWAEVHAHWDAAADEHGWNPSTTMKVVKPLNDLCRQGE